MSSTVKHTSAPWVVVPVDFGLSVRRESEDKGVYCEIVRDVGGEVFKDESGRYSDYQQIKANANLIAAAPELLSALKEMLAITSDSRGVAGYHLNGEEALWEEFNEVSSAIAAIAKAEGEQ